MGFLKEINGILYFYAKHPLNHARSLTFLKNFEDIRQIWSQVFLQLKIMLICLQFPLAGLVFSFHFLPTFRKYVIQLISCMLMDLKSRNPQLASSTNLYNIMRKTEPRVALHFSRINMGPEQLPNPIKINLEIGLLKLGIYTYFSILNLQCVSLEGRASPP